MAAPLPFSLIERVYDGADSSSTSNSSLTQVITKTVYTLPDPSTVSISVTNIILGILFMLPGLVNIFYGYKFIFITMGLTGFVLFGFLAETVLTLAYISNPFTPAFGTAITIIIAIIGGLLSFFFWEFGIYVLGAYGGYALGLGISGFATLNSAIATYIIIAIFIILAIIAVHFFERPLIIFATSIGGSFAFIYGLDYFARTGFQYIILYLHPKARDTYVFSSTYKFYLMLVGWLGLSILGIAWEWWRHEEMILEDKWGIRAWLERALCCCQCCGKRKKISATGNEVKVVESSSNHGCCSKRSKAPAKVIVTESPDQVVRNEKLRNAGVQIERRGGWGWW